MSTTGSAGVASADARPRDVREIIRDEQFMRGRILKVLESGPMTIPQIAEAVGKPSHEVVFWVMGLRKYGWIAEIKEVDDDGYFTYQAITREES
jgi:predicted Rossmann fold nucleotide-binding protein DprA/Smf involved in DNA uptake